jgi:hypothetical protein
MLREKLAQGGGVSFQQLRRNARSADLGDHHITHVAASDAAMRAYQMDDW